MRIIGWETNADESGHFIFMGLPAGEFRLHAKPPWGVEGLIASEPVMVNILIINLGPGEFFDISIGANPRETGMINDVLRIISTDPDLPGYEV